MNVYDAERMGEAFTAEGLCQTPTMDNADVIVLNTCHIREKAAEKVYSELGRVAQIKRDRAALGKDTVVAVTGCVAQAEGEEIVHRAPVVDVVVGPQNYHRLGDLIARSRSEARSVVDTEFPEEDKFEHLPKRAPRRRASAFLTVQEGCDKFCTFCVVPYTRGVEVSRPVEAVEAEAQALVEQGVREITLLGQNVNGYHGRDATGRTFTLADLIARLDRIVGVRRLRYTTSHPCDMTGDLIAAHRDIPSLMPHLHLPFQAGSDRILAAMNRKHTISDYLALVDRIRSARPDIALSTDIIVGFPGETDAEFEATLGVVRSVGFAQAFSFKYSPRPGTPAANLADQLPAAVADDRLQRLQAVLASQQRKFNDECVGRTIPVLFEKTGRHTGQLIGRSPYLQPVHAVAEQSVIGNIVDVTISTSGPNSLGGVVQQ
ncbi:MAG: hypothetical protein RLZ98_449 [Pseudomonadota bacterium]|jgi:tRNA-2-methylthio-N6-dimethylallyladenosine synthase